MIIAGELVAGTGERDPRLRPHRRHRARTRLPLRRRHRRRRRLRGRRGGLRRLPRRPPPSSARQFLEAIADQHRGRHATRWSPGPSPRRGLPQARITGEVGRTTGQLRLFAAVLREGSWNGARIDPALPDRTPLPRPDIRQRAVPLGPVAVFGASNFPLAFSVAGGDTASALAAGCPVVVKAHDAHPGTSELVGRAITDAVAAAGLPAGTFSLLFGSGPGLGTALVTDPRIKAVGFTGSRSGGMALVAAAAGRPEPIPVYAEMSSINPVFLLDGALASRGADLGRAFVALADDGIGPVLHEPRSGHRRRRPRPRRLRRRRPRCARTGAGHADADPDHRRRATPSGVAALDADADLVVRGDAGDDRDDLPGRAVQPPTPTSFRGSEALQAEVFGSSSLVVRCADAAEMASVAADLEGQLTATLHVDESDHDAGARSCCRCWNSRRAESCSTAGRPVSRSATRWCTAARPPPRRTRAPPRSARARSSASCGPCAYQDVPKALLPSAIADGNPDGLWRRIDGQLTQD